MAKSKKPNPFREEFACFLENPSREGLREVLKNHYGEFENLDFKEQWPERSALAKHVLGLANSGGGCLMFGVCENEDKTFGTMGLSAFKDKADLDNELRPLLPQALLENFLPMDFSFEAAEYAALVGKLFQILIVQDDPENLPFMAAAETADLRRTVVYVRRLASTHAATYEELQSVINRRLATGHSTQNALDLNKHLKDLEALHSRLARFRIEHPYASDYWSSPRLGMMGGTLRQAESLEGFLNRMILLKQEQIEKLLRG